MPEFIEVHHNGAPQLVNPKWVEKITPLGRNRACIYFAFSFPNALRQDFLEVDESYEELLRIVWR